MISGARKRRRSLFLWAVLASAIAHMVILVLVLRHTNFLITPPKGPDAEHITETRIVVQKPAPTPQPQRQAQNHSQVRVAAAAPMAAPPMHELAKEVPNAPPQPPAKHASTIETRIANDQKSFANEVAALNAGNDPHAIATIDPGTQESGVKSYGFQMSGGNGSAHGNGFITPTHAMWTDHGLDCYYGRYEFRYPSGEEEEGDIVWPFCYDPGSDPFKQPPHSIAFPPPRPGYVLPAGTQLPKQEQEEYERWLNGQG
jgi:hypothetical protein